MDQIYLWAWQLFRYLLAIVYWHKAVVALPVAKVSYVMLWEMLSLSQLWCAMGVVKLTERSELSMHGHSCQVITSTTLHHGCLRGSISQ